MLKISQNEGLFIIIFCIFIYEVIKVIRTKKIFLERDYLMKLVCKIYLAGVASKIYFPIVMGFGEKLKFNLPKIWLRPLWSIQQYIVMGGIEYCLYLVIGNILLLMPLGFFYGYFKGKKNIKKVIITFLKIGVFIEVSQMLVSLIIPNTVRFFEINDIILNAIGGVLGYISYRILVKVFNIKIF